MSWPEVFKINRNTNKRLDNTDALIGEVKTQVGEINTSVAKKPRTFFTTMTNTPLAATGTVILSLTGAGTINTMALQPFQQGSYTLTITIDGTVLITQGFNHGSGAGGVYSVITIGGTTGITLGSVLSTATSIPFLYSNFLNINYSKSVEIKLTPPAATNTNISIGHTREA